MAWMSLMMTMMMRGGSVIDLMMICLPTSWVEDSGLIRPCSAFFFPPLSDCSLQDGRMLGKGRSGMHILLFCFCFRFGSVLRFALGWFRWCFFFWRFVDCVFAHTLH